jgi:hypothetical protein
VLSYVNKLNIYGYGLDKLYDGTTNLLVTISSGLLSNDIINYTASFSSKNIGSNNLLPATLYGPQGNNYNLIYYNESATILPIQIYPIISSNKQYDRTNDISLIITLSCVLILDDPVYFNYLQPNYNVSTLGYYGIEPWLSNCNFVDISAAWIWTISGASIIAPVNSVGYQFQRLYNNTTNNIINAVVHIISDDVCNFYFNGQYVNSSIIGGYNTTSYSKIPIIIPLGTSIFEFESFNLGLYQNPAGILVSIIDDNNNILFHTDNNWVYSTGISRTSSYNNSIYVNNYYATISSTINNSILIYYNNLTLSGNNSTNYFINPEGFVINNYQPINLNAVFVSYEKTYDRILSAYLTYTISGIYQEHLSLVDICSNYIAQYRNYNASQNAVIDITNLTLYGQYSYLYQINPSTFTTSIIDQRYLFVLNGDKQYDRTVYAYLTLSNNINNDNIVYSANFPNYYPEQNKLITITLSNTINESLNNLLYKLSSYYSFNNDTKNGLTIANYGNYSINYDAVLSKNIIIDTSGMIIESGCLSLNYYNQEYLTLPKIYSDNNGLTFAFWFKANNTPNGSRIFEFSNGLNDKIYFGIYNNFINCGVYNIITQDYFNFYTVNVNDNKWRHLIWVLQPNNIWLIYINGILVNTNYNTIYPFAKVRTTNYIGKYFNGSIDDFRIYNRTFNSDDVNNLYNNKVFNLNNSNYLFYSNTYYGNIYQRVMQILGIPKTFTPDNIANLYLANRILNDDVDICNNYLSFYDDFNAKKNQLIRYDNLTTYGIDSQYYSYNISGITYGDILPSRVSLQFSTNKYYDKTQNYSVIYSLSGFYGIDGNYVSLSSSIIGYYRNYNAGSTYVDISNVYLYGIYPYSTNYYINYSYTTLQSIIYQRIVQVNVFDKIYDKTYNVNITLSNVISTDNIGYIASYNDYNVGYKPLNVTLSGCTLTSISGSISYSLITGFGNSTTPWSSSGVPSSITGMAMTSDQRRIIVSKYDNGFIYFSSFNGTTWSTFTQTLQTTSLGAVCGCSLTADG